MYAETRIERRRVKTRSHSRVDSWSSEVRRILNTWRRAKLLVVSVGEFESLQELRVPSTERRSRSRRATRCTGENFLRDTGLKGEYHQTCRPSGVRVPVAARSRPRSIMRLKLLHGSGKRAGVLGGLLLLGIWLSGCGGKSSSSSSTPATVNVTPKTASISPNRAQAFSATAQDSSGNTLTGVTFAWVSSAPNVASIDSNGVALGRTNGSTQITASASGVTSAPATLTVTQPIASITISPSTATIAVNATRQFTAAAVDANGNPVTGVIFTWACSFSGTATIDSNGLVTGVAPGTVTILASASGVTSPLATVTVTP
ncbi:MAG: Ig-like domain-containing protein [Acidobacteriia bacterium]|nr:Ig-like domain-containing protein [Terriglobia bacterium]